MARLTRGDRNKRSAVAGIAARKGYEARNAVRGDGWYLFKDNVQIRHEAGITFSADQAKKFLLTKKDI